MVDDRVAAAASERGEVLLRRRSSDGAVELRVNGVFVMDTVQTSSERLLAEATLARAVGDRLRVLVGGLGLGFTLSRLLVSERVAAVTVAEIEPALPQWHRAGLIPGVEDVLADPRVTIVLDDVANALAEARDAEFDLVLLDVDNGPDFLVYPANAALYRDEMLAQCRRVTRDTGVTAIWSMSRSGPLERSLAETFGAVEVIPVPVQLGTRAESYWLFLGSG